MYMVAGIIILARRFDTPLTDKKHQLKEAPNKGVTLFIRRVIHTTNGRLLNLTPVIPEDWEVVKVRGTTYKDGVIILTIIRMTGDNGHARVTADNKQDKQDTTEAR